MAAVDTGIKLLNPGDEVIIFDPYFVMYPPLVQLVGGTPVLIDTYPDFQIDLNKVEAAITDRTKSTLEHGFHERSPFRWTSFSDLNVSG